MKRCTVLVGLALAMLAAVVPSELMAGPLAEPPPDPPGPAGSAGSAGPAAAPAGKGVYERDVVEVEPTRSISLVNIDNRLGDVRIEGHDSKNVIISAFKRAGDEDTLDRLKVTLIPDPSGPVRISTSISEGTEARPIAGGSVKIDLVIRAPRTARVEARVWNGRLTVVGMENGAELSANKGDIDVANASGTIVTHSAAGKQKFVEIFGAIDAQVIAGDVDLSVVRGQRLDASVHQGRIEGRKVRVREVTILATRGDVRFQGHALAGGRYRIATHRGNIAVTFTHGVPVSVWAWSRQGRVELPGGVRTRADERGGLSASLPGESAPTALIELRSSVGNIEFAVVQ